jgi:iron complex transport system ATP-binding protein
MRLRNVSKYYGDVPVVKDVSLDIAPGKITSLIGPNGAGKSTLLGMMSRLIPRSTGAILVDGVDILEWDSTKLAQKIAILRQSNNLNLRLTVKELVSFGRFPHSHGILTEEDLDAVKRAIGYVQLEEFQDKYLDQLSGGQRQRAYIAMVIAQDTDYIFLDEPLNNLDMKHSVEMMKLLRRLVDESGKAVVIVLHDINFASCYSDHIVAMEGGLVVKEGPGEVVIQESVLSDLYKLNFEIQNVRDNRICVYY